MVRIAVYSNRPGQSGEAPSVWPVRSEIPRETGCPTLVMFAHPRCPCTRASLGELERLMASYHGKLKAHVLILQPAGTPENWAATDLWRHAAAIPGVKTSADRQGAEARRFGSETSGNVVLYDADGRLMFQGGITISRGHAGDNPGRTALAACLLREISHPLDSHPLDTPVFGCELFGPGISRCVENGQR